MLERPFVYENLEQAFGKQGVIGHGTEWVRRSGPDQLCLCFVKGSIVGIATDVAVLSFQRL